MVLNSVEKATITPPEKVKDGSLIYRGEGGI